MKFLLECVILEITTKSFRNREGAEQLYYVAQCYQPGIGVDEISMEKISLIAIWRKSARAVFTLSNLETASPVLLD